MKQPLQVERISNPGREVFERDYVASNRPVIITDGISHWPALSRWSEDYFRSRMGKHRATVEVRRNHMSYGEHYVSISLDEYFDHLKAGRVEYFLADKRLEEELPMALEDVPKPDFIARGVPYMFIGKDTFAAMHYHAYEQAVLCQVVGPKRVLLFGLEDFHRIRPGAWFTPHFNWSSIDFRQPEVDTKAFPEYAKAQPYECVLQPGDALFIPIYWWHATYGTGMSFSTTYFWRAPLRQWSFPSPAIRSLVGRELTNRVYEPASRIDVLARLYFQLRRWRMAR